MSALSVLDRDIVIVGQQPWDVEIGSNCKNIAVELAKSNRVLYVNSPLDRITSWRRGSEEKIIKRKEIIKGEREGLDLISDNLWTLYPDVLVESINWIKHIGLFNFLNKRNNRLLSESINRSIEILDFKKVILFNDNDIFKSFYLSEFLEPELSIYYSRDYMLGVDYWKRHGEFLEPELIRKNDLCVANSIYLRDYCMKYNPNSFYIGQGCELDIFSDSEELSRVGEIDKLPGKIIGYVGALQSIRLDIELIAYIAESNPEWTIVLVGPEDDTFLNSVLHSLSNIHFLGSKQPEELPQYINSFDVCINPQLVNQITIGNYPRKIDEYLAMGKPVVATFTPTVSIFEDCIYLAKDKYEFVKMIDSCLENDSDDRIEYRKSVAHSHSWKNSVAELYQAINHTINERCRFPPK